MSETTQADHKHFSILVETAEGSETFTLREPFEGSADGAREYAQKIANAEGRRVKINNAADNESDIVTPQQPENV